MTAKTSRVPPNCRGDLARRMGAACKLTSSRLARPGRVSAEELHALVLLVVVPRGILRDHPAVLTVDLPSTHPWHWVSQCGATRERAGDEGACTASALATMDESQAAEARRGTLLGACDAQVRINVLPHRVAVHVAVGNLGVHAKALHLRLECLTLRLRVVSQQAEFGGDVLGRRRHLCGQKRGHSCRKRAVHAHATMKQNEWRSVRPWVFCGTISVGR